MREAEHALPSAAVISLRRVDERDCQFLYDLLLERDPTVNINHRQMPTYEQHCAYVKCHPYSVWCVIERDNQPIGSINLARDGAVGLFIKKDHQSNGYGKTALKLLMHQAQRDRYLARINPLNHQSQEFFIRSGFKPIEHIYEWRE